MTTESVFDEIINMGPKNARQANQFLLDKYSHLDNKFLLAVAVLFNNHFG